jgi:hypothetical protein
MKITIEYERLEDMDVAEHMLDRYNAVSNIKTGVATFDYYLQNFNDTQIEFQVTSISGSGKETFTGNIKLATADIDAKPGQTFQIVCDGNVIAEIKIPDIKVQNLRFHYNMMVRGELLLDDCTGDEFKEAYSKTTYAKTAERIAVKEPIKEQLPP